MSAQEPELDVPEVDEVDTPFKRRLAVAVAVLALFGGIVGFAAGEAGAQEDSTGAAAQRASVLAMSGYSTSAVEFYEMLENSLDAASLQDRGQIADARAALLGLTSQRRIARQWDSVAREVSTSSVLSGQSAYTGGAGRLLVNLTVAPDLAFLRQQAEAQTSAQWAGKRRLEIGIVTLLAVALTLLGLSLTMGEGIRKFLIWPAGVFTGVCVVGFGWVLSQPVVATPDAAIKAVAAGDRLDQLRDYSAAVASYTRAIDLQPGYAIALADRATAGIVAASPQRNSISYVVTTSTTAAYRSAISDYLQALANGGDQYPIDVNLGGAYFHVRDYADTASYSQQAISLNPGPPLPWLNLALALLAEGRTAQALRTYHHTIALIAARPDPVERAELYSSALTALEILAGQQPTAVTRVRAVEGELAAAESAQRVPHAVTASHASVSVSHLTVTGPRLHFTFTYRDIPTGSRLAEIVYVRPHGTANWIQPSQLTYFLANSFPSSFAESLNLPDRSCPVPSTYRVDLYAGSRRLASATASSSQPAESMLPYTNVVDGIELCRPRGWSFSSGGPITLTSPDRQRQLSIQVAPLPPADLHAHKPALVRAVLARMIRQLSAHPTGVQKGAPGMFGTMTGTLQVLRLPGNRVANVWASAGADGILRTLVATFPAGQPGPLNDVASYLTFLP
jgi:tetratricopeptide (TPR) repeat protein